MTRISSRWLFATAGLLAAAWLSGCAPLRSGTYYKPVDAGEKGFLRNPQNSISRRLGQGAQMEFGVQPVDPDADEAGGAKFSFKVVVPADTLVQFGSRTFRVRDEITLSEYTFDADFIVMHEIDLTPEDEDEEVAHETWEIDFMDRFRGATYTKEVRVLPDTILHNFYVLEFTIDELNADRFSVFFPVVQVNHISVDILPVQFERAESKWYMGEIVP